jgi:hypothetical protein
LFYQHRYAEIHTGDLNIMYNTEETSMGARLPHTELSDSQMGVQAHAGIRFELPEPPRISPEKLERLKTESVNNPNALIDLLKEYADKERQYQENTIALMEKQVNVISEQADSAKRQAEALSQQVNVQEDQLAFAKSEAASAKKDALFAKVTSIITLIISVLMPLISG